MKWPEIKRRYPDKFILIGDIIEEKISENKSKVLEGEVLEVSDNGKDIMNAYQHYKKKGFEVLFSLPSTPEVFIIRNVPFKGMLKFFTPLTIF